MPVVQTRKPTLTMCLLKDILKKDIYKDKRAVTLVEVVACIAIIGMIVSLVWQVESSMTKGYYDTRDEIWGTEEMRLVSSFIEEEIRLAMEVKVIVATSEGRKNIEDVHKGISYLVDEIVFVRPKGDVVRLSQIEDDNWVDELTYQLIYQNNVLIDDIEGFFAIKQREGRKVDIVCRQEGKEIWVVLNLSHKKN